MKLEMRDPQNGRQVELDLPEWKLMMGMMGGHRFLPFPGIGSCCGCLAGESELPTDCRGDGRRRSSLRPARGGLRRSPGSGTAPPQTHRQ